MNSRARQSCAHDEHLNKVDAVTDVQYFWSLSYGFLGGNACLIRANV